MRLATPTVRSLAQIQVRAAWAEPPTGRPQPGRHPLPSRVEPWAHQPVGPARLIPASRRPPARTAPMRQAPGLPGRAASGKQEGPPARAALPLSDRGPARAETRALASCLRPGPRQRRRSSSRLPYAANDNETLDHLLSVVERSLKYRGAPTIRKSGSSAKERERRSVRADSRGTVLLRFARNDAPLQRPTSPTPACRAPGHPVSADTCGRPSAAASF
jgi:hypothetical protein